MAGDWHDDLDVVGRIESHLEPDEYRTLSKLLSRERVDPDAFLDVAAARQVFTLLALGNRAEEIQREEALTESAAWRAACREFGVPWRQVRQWRSRSWSPSSK